MKATKASVVLLLVGFSFGIALCVAWNSPYAEISPLDFASILIAGLAVFIAYDSSRANRLHNEQSVMPMLQMSYSLAPKHGVPDVLSVSMKNCGLGAAIIKSAEYEFQQKPLSSLHSWISAFMERTSFQTPPVTRINNIAGRGEKIAANDEHEFIYIEMAPLSKEERYNLVCGVCYLTGLLKYCSVHDIEETVAFEPGANFVHFAISIAKENGWPPPWGGAYDPTQQNNDGLA